MLTQELSVAKGRGGRPKKSDGEKGTRHVRVHEDLASMIGWIHHFESQESNVTVAQILDPMLRDQVIERYAPYAEVVRKIQEAEKTVEQSSQKKRRV
jgi:hypothetical protein